MDNKTIYEYIKTEETNYQTMSVTIIEGYEWNMFDHVKKSTLYKNSQYETGKTDDKPFFNIIRPILNVGYRTVGFDVKDIDLYVNSDKDYYKSFLARKYHYKWALKNKMDTFIDDLVESYIDYGGVIVKKTKDNVPEVVPLQRLAFVDQTDILSGAICEKHQFSVSDLKDMSGNWYAEAIDEAIENAKMSKINSQANNLENKTPSKYIEVYELHGVFPESWLYEDGDEDKYCRQSHFIILNQRDETGKSGVTLFKGKEKEAPYKVELRDKIYGRALGFGGIEELFEAQIWTNYSAIQVKEMLDVASNMLLQTSDEALAGRNNLNDLEKGEILFLEDGKTISPVNTQPINLQLFDNHIARWENLARTTGSANEAVLGESPNSGTPFALQSLVTTEGKSLHQYRQGKIASFVEEIYRDWVLEALVKEINKGHKWVDDLSLEELNLLVDSVVINELNEKIKDLMLNKDRIITEEEQVAYKELVKEQFMGKQTKFVEIIQDEIKNIPIDVSINIKGKQKNLAQNVDKLTDVFRQVISAPQVLQIPGMAKLFNQIIESSGLSPLDFSGVSKAQLPTSEAPTPTGIPVATA